MTEFKHVERPTRSRVENNNINRMNVKPVEAIADNDGRSDFNTEKLDRVTETANSAAGKGLKMAGTALGKIVGFIPVLISGAFKVAGAILSSIALGLFFDSHRNY